MFAWVPIEKYTLFSKLPSHKVRQLVFGRPSGRVHSASLPHERLTVAWGSEIRTASGGRKIGVREYLTFLTLMTD